MTSRDEQPLVCLRCLVDTADDAAAILELVEGTCRACGRYGPASRQLEAVPAAGADQETLFRSQ